MDFIKTYGNFIKRYTANRPEISFNMIKLGLFYELNRLTQFPDKNIPRAYQKLSQLTIQSLYNSLKDPENAVWVNIFAPVELLQNFDLNPLSIECFSSFMSGFRCEDLFIDHAEKEGITETLCSYHKAFLGAATTKILPRPKMAITTSMVCDGNINTFRHLSNMQDIPLYILDIPYEYSSDSEIYVVSQLQELITQLEELTHKKFDLLKLKEALDRENQSKAYYQEFLKLSAHRHYPSTLALQLFMLFPSHLSIGTKETLELYKLFCRDIQNYPKTDAHKVFWVHLMPYYHKALQDYFNFNTSYQIQATDFSIDYMEPLDIQSPLRALAKKMILNIYNGPFERKIEAIMHQIKTLESDSVIQFCHWGCKQSAGGAMLLKDSLKTSNIPMLILDGDCLDARNSPEGQIKTRLEAFFEMIKNTEEEKNHDRLCL